MSTDANGDRTIGFASGKTGNEMGYSPQASSNSAHTDYSTSMCIPQLIEKQVIATPDALALRDGERSLCYQELNQRANRLAYYLQTLGVRPDTLVGLCLERSIEMAVGLLAILKAGGAYVPLDPTYPSERLTFMLQNAQVPVLITRQQIAARLAVQDARVICLDDDSLDLAPMSLENPLPAASLDDLAYTVYTSGSTGQPKGVQVTHRSLLNVVSWYQQTFKVQHADRSTLFFSPAFDVTGQDLWPNLAAGACLYLVDEAISFNPVAIRDWLVSNGITIANFPTVLVESLITLDWPATTALRVMLVGGDTLHSYPPASLPFALFNNYGPSETTIVATSGRVYPDAHATMPPSIGRPIANTYVYILDEHLQPVPAGEAGEMYIGGVGVARGYLNRPDLTAERFIAHPFNNRPGARLYKTGDLGRYLPDGQLMFIGRADHQVKIRGFRIELDEIETTLLQHPAISQAVVAAREDLPGEKYLVGYVVCRPGQLITSDELRAFLKAWLPDYMIPMTFVFVEALPLTPNGKVDRAALPAPNATSALPDEAMATSLIEERLAEIMATLLRREQVSKEDNFFMLGGDSLLAAQVILRVAEEFGIDLSLHRLFEAPTVSALAAEIERDIIARLETMSDDELSLL